MPKAIRRAKERNMPPTSSTGRFSRIDRWSVVQRKVANDCRKKRSPPVARSWLTGGEERIGEMISRCTSTPRRATAATAPPPASHTGHPAAETRK